MKRLKLIVITLILTLSWQATSLACDGEPPELINKDSKEYKYELVCGGKTVEGKLVAGAKQKLDGRAGCKLKLGENKVTKLHTDMVCTVKNARLTCDLL